MTAGWYEVRVQAPAARCPALLTEIVGPFLGEAGGRGHFIPDWERDQLSVFLRSAEEAGALSSRLRAQHQGELQVIPGARTAIHDVQMSGPGAQELVDDFLADSSAFVLSLLPRTAGDAVGRGGVAFDLMASQPIALRPLLFPAVRAEPCPLAFISYRSHVDGFFIMSKDPAATRAAFDERFARTAAALVARLAALVDQLEGRGPLVSTPARDWAVLVGRYQERVRAGLQSGGLELQMEAGEGYMGAHYDLTVSPFHQVIDADPVLRDRAARDPDFNTMRVLASLLYLTLHRLGLRFIERYLFCHSVARAYETGYGLEPAQALTRFARVFDR